MSIVRKVKRVFRCVDKSSKGSLVDNDYLEPILSNDEFKFEKPGKENMEVDSNPEAKFPIYNDYDNLQHKTLAKNKKGQATLKDCTNLKPNKSFKRSFIGKPTKNCEKINFNYCELYDENKLIVPDSILKAKQKVENVHIVSDDVDYCEIPDNVDMFSEDEPLINLTSKPEHTYNKLGFSDSKMNLFTKFEANDQQNNDERSTKCLTEIRDVSSFQSPSEAFHWYLNTLSETMSTCVQSDKLIADEERAKRLHIIQAHLLYARNFYEMRIAGSAQLKVQLNQYHPCLIALACLLDSDAVRIVESHSCACDNYIYLFSTRLKFCAWKSKMYIILKRPKRSSIDRLNLIEDLKNCHKIIQDKQLQQA